MKISIAAFTASLSFVVSEPEDLNPAPYGEVPPGLADGGQEAWAAFVEAAFPTWCIDENENRQTDKETCDDGTTNGRYDPLYLTKWHSGEDPSLGGYPTNREYTEEWTRHPDFTLLRPWSINQHIASLVCILNYLMIFFNLLSFK